MHEHRTETVCYVIVHRQFIRTYCMEFKVA